MQARRLRYIEVLATGFGGLEDIYLPRLQSSLPGHFEQIPGDDGHDPNDRLAALAAGRKWMNSAGRSPATALTGFERVQEDKLRDAPLSSGGDPDLCGWRASATIPHLRNLGVLRWRLPKNAHPIPEPGSDLRRSRQGARRAKAAILPSMNQRLGILSPNAAIPMPPTTRWNCSTLRLTRWGRNQLKTQYWRVNVDPSEHYVLSVPGSVEHRLWPDGLGMDEAFSFSRATGFALV